MADEAQAIGAWIQELVTRAVQEQVHTAQRFSELLQHVMPNDLVDSGVRDEYARFAREEAARFARGLATLSLNYFNSVLELSRASNERFIRQVMQASETGKTPAPSAASKPVPVELRAPVGQEASAAFVIENKRAEAAQVSFLVSEFMGEGEAAPFRAPLQITPPRLTLNPREDIVVRLRLALLPELFSPGKRYTARVRVSGYEDMELVLHVLPEAPDKSKRARKITRTTRKARPASPSRRKPTRSTHHAAST